MRPDAGRQRLSWWRWALLALAAGLTLPSACKAVRRGDAGSALDADGAAAVRRTGVDPEDSRSLLTLDYGPFFASVGPSGAGDPDGGRQAGLDAIMRGDGFQYGLPTSLIDQADVMVRAKRAGTDMPTLHWNIFGNIPRPPPRAGGESVAPGPYLSLGQGVYTVKDGSRSYQYANESCFACHVGVVAGKVVPGAANTYHDATGLHLVAKNLQDAWDSWVKAPALKLQLTAAQVRSVDGFIWHFKKVVSPIFAGSGFRGANMGAYTSWKAVAANPDPRQGFGIVTPEVTTALEKEFFPDGVKLPPLDPNPWWARRYRDKVFWYQDGANLDDPEQEALHFAPGFVVAGADMNAGFAREVSVMRTIFRYVDQLTPPPLPQEMPVDPALVEAGRRLFHGESSLAGDGSTLVCTSCHGTYRRRSAGWLVSFSEGGTGGAITLQEVGTDPEYSKMLIRFRALARHMEGLGAYFQRHRPATPYPRARLPRDDQRGAYAPPPLVGLWATAPYFHNGSVPTLWAVLKSSARPRLWLKSHNPASYDYERVGLAVREISTDEAATIRAAARGRAADNFETPAAVKARRLYDAHGHGMDNGGHDFGDALSDDERRAVVEFLKVITGPDVVSAAALPP